MMTPGPWLGGAVNGGGEHIRSSILTLLCTCPSLCLGCLFLLCFSEKQPGVPEDSIRRLYPKTPPQSLSGANMVCIFLRILSSCKHLNPTLLPQSFSAAIRLDPTQDPADPADPAQSRCKKPLFTKEETHQTGRCCSSGRDHAEAAADRSRG